MDGVGGKDAQLVEGVGVEGPPVVREDVLKERDLGNLGQQLK